jgi:maltooligosyltrehalose trehalohydrolase
MPAGHPSTRHLRVGAQLTGGTSQFRVWAPEARQVTLVLEGPLVLEGEGRREVRLEQEAEGHFAVQLHGLAPGTLYRYRLDDRGPFPDPGSRFQPQGPHGPSMLVDPGAYRWHDPQWRGVGMKGQVVYEMHIGTFTREGTFDAAIAHLDVLRQLGVTVLEVMPVCEFPGRWNWGYDGVNLYAPYRR